MKKTLALFTVLCMILSVCAGLPAFAAEDTYTVTFSTGETHELPAGEDLVFFFQCDAPGDMGAPDEEAVKDLPDDEKGAGITVSEGEVSYSHVGVGGPYQYPTSELVTVTGITGDIEVTVAEEASFMDATHTIYFEPDEIEEAIAFAEEMAAQMAANPMSGEPSGEASSGEPSGMPPITGDFEITVDGVTDTAHYTDVDHGDSATKDFEITWQDEVITGGIDHGKWVADDEANQEIVDAVRIAYETENYGAPSEELADEAP